MQPYTPVGSAFDRRNIGTNNAATSQMQPAGCMSQSEFPSLSEASQPRVSTSEQRGSTRPRAGTPRAREERKKQASNTAFSNVAGMLDAEASRAGGELSSAVLSNDGTTMDTSEQLAAAEATATQASQPKAQPMHTCTYSSPDCYETLCACSGFTTRGAHSGDCVTRGSNMRTSPGLGDARTDTRNVCFALFGFALLVCLVLLDMRNGCEAEPFKGGAPRTTPCTGELLKSSPAQCSPESPPKGAVLPAARHSPASPEPERLQGRDTDAIVVCDIHTIAYVMVSLKSFLPEKKTPQLHFTDGARVA